MKRIILTESQYKRLVSQPLNEQEIIFGDGYTFSDAKNVNIQNILLVLSDSLWYNYKQNLYIKSIDEDKVIIDLEKYDEEVKEYIKKKMKMFLIITDNPGDSIDDKGNVDFSFDTEPVEDEEQYDDVYTTEDDFKVDSEFGSSNLTNKEKIILHLISEKEAVSHSYDSANPGKIIPGLSKLTMEQAKIKNGSSAIGRYQFMPENLNGFVTSAGLKMSDKFSPKNQDKMALAILKGKMDDCDELHNKLVSTWAALPLLYDREITYKKKVYKRKRGDSYYEGISGNKAGLTPEHFESALSSCGCNMTKLNKKLEIKINGESDVKDSGGGSIDLRNKIVTKSESRLGEPYEIGDEFDEVGGDCSGLIDWVLRNTDGIDSPYNGRETSANLKTLVKPSNKKKKIGLNKGDILVFNKLKGEKYGHVGFVHKVTDGKVDMIHSSGSKGVNITKDIFNNSFWSGSRYYGAIPIVDGKYESN